MDGVTPQVALDVAVRHTEALSWSTEGEMASMTAGVDVMGRRVVTRTVGQDVVRFVWEGGAYVDIRVRGRAVDVINVWANGTDSPRIPRTTEALADEVDKWLAEYGEAFLHDLLWGNYQ